MNGQTTRAVSGIPEGYLAIPVNAADQGAALRLCVLVRETPDPAAGHLVLLRDLHDAAVYLGCVVDACGRPREWIELWVQNVEGLEASLPSFRETFSNHALDARWRAQAAALAELEPGRVVSTGWETAHPRPSFLDLLKAQPVHPGADTPDGAWELCQDDERLRQAGLPPFSTSLVRYLWQPGAGAASKFVPVVSGAPQNAATVALAEILRGVDQHIALNPQAGLMLATRLAPVAYEDYVDLLAGKPWGGLEHGKRRLLFDGPYRRIADAAEVEHGPGLVFWGTQGRAGRFVETFHLKLQLLADAFALVRGYVARQQLPCLNLSAESFRVSLAESSARLPFLWSARCVLVKPGHAFALPVETSDFRYFIRARGTGLSVYLPEGLSAPTQGLGSVRIREVLPPDQGRVIVEGTLVPAEPLAVSPHDLLWLRVPLPGGRVDLYGHAYAAESLARGETRFRTVPQRLAEPVVQALRGAAGVSFARSPFEVVPLLSSPCDLYSLGVLAVRTLLVDERTTLPVALDEVLSLARQVAAEHQPDRPAGERVRAILERDRRYAESLGPHRLNRAGWTCDQAFALLPAPLWCETLALVVSLFPGLGPDSVCKDFGDVPAGALERVFDSPLEKLDTLVRRSRSLLLGDWTQNREVHAVIQDFLAKV